jgi:hypothetical protein
VVPDDRKRDFLAKITILELLHDDPTKITKARDLYERFISWGSDGVSAIKRTGLKSENQEVGLSKPNIVDWVEPNESADNHNVPI